MKDKNPFQLMQKTFWQNSIFFHDKIFNILVIEGNYFNIIKATYDKPAVNIILIEENLKTFPLRSETRQEFLIFIFLFNIVLKVLARKLGKTKK